jgi:threonine/homoserine/homoserine lactone efflux protein
MGVTFISNFLLGVALTLPLGPVNLEVIRRGLRQGLWKALESATGALTAELIYFSLVYFGLARFATHPTISIGLGVMGVFLLLYFGYLNYKDYVYSALVGKEQEESGIYRSAYVSGFLITFVNPLNVFLWIGIIGGFFAQNASLFISSGVLVGIILSLYSIAIMSKIASKLLKGGLLKYISLLAGYFLCYYGMQLLHDMIF